MPDEVADWFRATLKSSKVDEHVDPLVHIVPAAPGIVFKDGDRTYELYFRSDSLAEKERGKIVRFHQHDAWGRLESFRYGSGSKALLQYLQDEAKAGQQKPIRVEIVGLGEEIELPKDVGDWFLAQMNQSELRYFNSAAPTPDSLPMLIFKDGQRILELHIQRTLVEVTTRGRWGRQYSHDAFGEMCEHAVEIRNSVKWDQEDRKAIVTKLWLEYFQKEVKAARRN